MKVLDARTLAYSDGTEAVVDGMMDAPELGQKGSIDGKLYPCGEEAAEFLRKLIGGRDVTRFSSSKSLVSQPFVPVCSLRRR